MKKGLLLLLLLFAQIISAQITYKTSQSVSELIAIFNSSKNPKWSIPVTDNEKLTLKWTERITSFTEKEGIRSFVGYKDDIFVATLSFSKTQNISGSFVWKDTQWRIVNSKDGFLIIEKEPDAECGLNKNEYDIHNDIIENNHNTYHKHNSEKKLNLEETLDNYEIFSDGILRIYRLAVLVDYSYFNLSPFDGSKDKVKTFWAQLESFMNELYMRDIGVKFQIVDDERLIRDTEEKKVYKTSNPDNIYRYSTYNISELIGENIYDIGISIAYIDKYNGLAELFSAYSLNSKGNAVAKPKLTTIAHEIGHLFGSDHTFAEGGVYTMKTEPGNGRSIMSYGSPRDFFSLPSIYYIRKAFVNHADYYEDKERTHLVNKVRAENPVYGINTHNRPPLINRAKLKKEYIIPKNTFFQFDIKATDPDGDPLLYTVHQADIRRYDPSIAKFISEKSSRNNLIAFHKKYNKSGNFALIPGTTYDGTGEFTFWIGVNDTKNNPEEILNHATRYDMLETKLKIVEGIPFKLTNFKNKEYKTGEKVHLTWDVDEKLFANTKVRILLSDDFGETFKHVLVPSTENDGSCDIVMPNVTIGKTDRYNNIFVTGDALLKIEVIDNIAFDLTDNNIANGGFSIKPSEITFQNLPKEYIEVNDGNIPQVANVTATSTCAGDVSVSLETIEKENAITRTWTATDLCGNQSFAVQNIKINSKPKNIAPLEFNEPLPESMRINCASDFEYITPKLTVKGGVAPKVEYNENISKLSYDNYYIKRTWIATDEIAEPITYVQEIYLNDIEPPVFSSYPEDMIVESEENIPSQENLTATDCGESVWVDKSSKDIIDENGRKIKQYIWKAQDKYFNQAIHTQNIYIATNNGDNVSPVFNSTPKNINTDKCQYTLDESNDIKIGDWNEGAPAEGYVADNDKIVNLKIIEINGKSVDKTSLKGTTPKTGKNIIKWEATDSDGNTATHEQVINIIRGACYMPGVDGDGVPSNLILSTKNSNLDEELLKRKNGILILDSKNKGLIITTIRKGNNLTDIKTPIEGMIIFDENDSCLKLFDGKTWGCIQQKTIK